MKNRQGDEQRRIVVGVDGFESSQAALRWAIGQARLTGAAVEAVIAWHVPAGTGWIPAPDMPDYRDDAFTVLAETITEICAVDPYVQVCPRVLEGQAGQVLVQAADGADLLVVGSEGHRGLAEALLGSVGQYCANNASCPVLIIRGKREGRLPHHRSAAWPAHRGVVAAPGTYHRARVSGR